MNYRKGIFLLLMLSFLSLRANSSDGLTIHVSCEKLSDSCIEVGYASKEGAHVRIQKEPEMVFTPDNVSEAEIIQNDYGQEQLSLQLRPEAALQFEKLTSDYIGQQIVFVAGGLALASPTIKEKITGGSLMIASGIGYRGKHLHRLPWLKRMSEKKKAKDKKSSFMSTGLGTAIGIAILAVFAYFALFRRRSKSNQSS